MNEWMKQNRKCKRKKCIRLKKILQKWMWKIIENIFFKIFCLSLCLHIYSFCCFSSCFTFKKYLYLLIPLFYILSFIVLFIHIFILLYGATMTPYQRGPHPFKGSPASKSVSVLYGLNIYIYIQKIASKLDDKRFYHITQLFNIKFNM